MVLMCLSSSGLLTDWKKLPTNCGSLSVGGKCAFRVVFSDSQETDSLHVKL